MNNEDSVLNCKLDNNLSIRVPGKQVLLFFSPTAIFTDGWLFFVGFTVYLLLSQVSAKFTTEWVTELID